MKFFGLASLGGAVIGSIMLTGAASAAPIMAQGINTGDIAPAYEITQVQVPARRVPGAVGRGAPVRGAAGPVRGGGRGFARGGGRGIGPAGAAAIIGLGVLGAAAAASAANCYERQPVVDPYGYVVGYRRVYVC